MSIKLDQGAQQGGQQGKVRGNLKQAIRLAEKQEQDIIFQLQQLHNSQLILHIDYDQEKTQLQKCLDMPSSIRNRKQIRNIKAQLSYLSCFQIQTQNEMPKELLAIMKRDIDMLTAVISKFVYPRIYPKGSIIQTVSSQRQSVKILLKGDVVIYQPINYKSFKNCLKNKKLGTIQTEWLGDIIDKFNKDNIQSFYQQQTDFQQIKLEFNPESIQDDISSSLNKKHKPLSLQICKKMLMHSNIITPNTPHRQTKNINQTGHLISSQRQPYIVSQAKTIQHTALCLTETYVVEIQYAIYKTAISLLNSDQQKKYIQILLRKFNMFEYFDAKQYVKKQYMIDRKREQQQQKKKEQQQKKLKQQNLNLISEFMLTNQFSTQKIIRQKHQTQQSEQSSKKEKENDQEMDTQTYEIKYDGDIYLIISGEATIIIDKIGEIRLSSLQHASKIRSFKSHQVLKLYTSDIFGFQEIGKIKQYNLRYRINKNSKLLLLSQNIYIKHFDQIIGFKNLFKSLQKERNQLIHTIVKDLQKSIESQQLKRYQSISSIQTNKRANSLPFHQFQSHSPTFIKRVQFVGYNQFEAIENKIKSKLSQQKQGKSNAMNFKQVIKNGKQLKDSLSFASIYKQHLPNRCQIVGNYIQVRDNKGNLQRKKCIKEGSNNEIQKQRQLFRKLGIISDEDRNKHNFALISNRKSKYQLEDFSKQKKEMDRLKNISQSLPKLNFFYAKKSQILYRSIHKRDV